MMVTEASYRENPFCNGCLLERIEGASGPILGWETVDGYVSPVRPTVE